MESLKTDLIIGFASFSISEAVTIIGKKIFRSALTNAANNTTKKASKQLHQIMNGRNVKNLVPNAKSIYNRFKIAKYILEGGEKYIGALYSFTNGIFHSTIIDW